MGFAIGRNRKKLAEISGFQVLQGKDILIANFFPELLHCACRNPANFFRMFPRLLATPCKNRPGCIDDVALPQPGETATAAEDHFKVRGDAVIQRRFG